MNIHISNLDQNVTEETLVNLFKQHGEVKAAELVRDVFTGQPRGFAYVEMTDDTEAQNAIGTLNNSQLNDRAILVAEAKPKEERRGSYRVGSGAQSTSGFQRSFGFQNKKGFRKR